MKLIDKIAYDYLERHELALALEKEERPSASAVIGIFQAGWKACRKEWTKYIAGHGEYNSIDSFGEQDDEASR